MSSDSPRARQVGARLVAAAAAGFVAAAALSTPAAAAEIPGIVGTPTAALALGTSITAGATLPGQLGVVYTPVEGQESTTHEVVAEFALDDPDAVLTIGNADAACDDLAADHIVCTVDAAGPSTGFAFELTADGAADDDVIGYTFRASVDGEEVANSTGSIEVASTYDVHNPYAHSDFVVTDVGSGEDVKVKPLFYQDFDLAPTAAAMLISFTNPLPGGDLDTSGLVSAYDTYQNCRTVHDGDTATGVECVITDLPDVKGQFLTLETALLYRVESGMVGPLDLCDCRYSVTTIDADTLAEYDDLSWVGTTIELATAPEGWEGAEDSIAYYWGGITLTTESRTYDLDVSETVIEGIVGDEVTVTTDIINNGPAGGPDLNPESGSYLVRGQLPEGTELVRVDSDGAGAWDCYGAGELDEVHAATTTLLERFDFACTLDRFGFRARPDITYTVKLTDKTAYQGAIEIGAVYNDGEFEGNPDSDFALVHVAATEARYDYNQDDYDDLLVIRKSDGALRLYPGTSAGTYKAAVTVGTGWAQFDIVMAGDLTGDAVPDLLARDNKTGSMWTYPGNGQGGFKSRILVGNGWNKMGQFSVGYYDGDGNPDILATAYADGVMYFYPGKGNGLFGARSAGGDGWDGMDVITSIGDIDADGFDEFLSRWNYDGRYYIYSSQGGVFELNQGMHTYGDYRFDQVTGIGDLDRDGRPDFAGADLVSGKLISRSFDPNLPTQLDSTVIGNGGWNGMRLPVPVLDRSRDIDYDGYSEVFAQHKTSGDLFLYWGTGTGLGSRVTLCDDCDGITMTIPGGDYNSDGRTDMVIRTYTGELQTIVGTDNSEPGFQWSPYTPAGTGWNSMNAITGGHDYNGDGRDDLVARQTSTGYLFLYPGRGNGTFGSRIQLGSGWNSMRDISAVGDLDHDGHADLLAIRTSDGCLYRYSGRGDGTVKNGVQVSCGWGGYDQVTGVGDFNRDGHADWLARRKSDGALFLYPGNGSGGTLSRKQIGTGWNSMSYIA